MHPIDYPDPIVDLKHSYQFAKETLWKLKPSKGYGENGSGFWTNTSSGEPPAEAFPPGSALICCGHCGISGESSKCWYFSG